MTSPQKTRASERVTTNSAFGFQADAEIQVAFAAAGGGVATLPVVMAAGRSRLGALALRTAATMRVVMGILRRTEALRPPSQDASSGDA